MNFSGPNLHILDSSFSIGFSSFLEEKLQLWISRECIQFKYSYKLEICMGTGFELHPHLSTHSMNPSPHAPTSTWIHTREVKRRHNFRTSNYMFEFGIVTFDIQFQLALGRSESKVLLLCNQPQWLRCNLHIICQPALTCRWRIGVRTKYKIIVMLHIIVDVEIFVSDR